MKALRLNGRIQFVMIALLIGAFAFPAAAALRVMGKVDARAHGSQDLLDEAHVWLQPRLDVKVVQQGGPLSVNVIADYIADTGDESSDNGRFRYLRGLIQYGTITSPVTARVGRFFRYDGVSVGVIDGFDVAWRFAKGWRIAVVGGLLGPRSREFEFEDVDQSATFGGELKWTPRSVPLLGPSSLVLSFARQERQPGITRNLVGFSTRHRLNQSMTWFNVLHVRPTDAPLRKFITRLRMQNSWWRGTAEIGVIDPNVPGYSWFSSFGEGSSLRFRLAIDRHIEANRWAGGIEGVVLSGGGKNGFRGGPVVSTPCGQVGYRISSGDQALGAGPWASLIADPYAGVHLYAYGALLSYEWEAFEIQSDELATARGGVRYTPWFEKALEITAELQVYRTPQVEYDWRSHVGVSWRFDTGRGQ
jgi:hypothetical protein